MLPLFDLTGVLDGVAADETFEFADRFAITRALDDICNQTAAPVTVGPPRMGLPRRTHVIMTDSGMIAITFEMAGPATYANPSVFLIAIDWVP